MKLEILGRKFIPQRKRGAGPSPSLRPFGASGPWCSDTHLVEENVSLNWKALQGVNVRSLVDYSAALLWCVFWVCLGANEALTCIRGTKSPVTHLWYTQEHTPVIYTRNTLLGDALPFTVMYSTVEANIDDRCNFVTLICFSSVMGTHIVGTGCFILSK